MKDDRVPMTDTDTNDQKPKSVLSLSGNKLGLGKKASDHVQQSFSHGRSKTVQVEVKRKRVGDDGPAIGKPATTGFRQDGSRSPGLRQLTEQEREARMKALSRASDEPRQERTPSPHVWRDATVTTPQKQEEKASPLDADALRQRELDEMKEIDSEERRLAEEAEKQRAEAESKRREGEQDRQSIADRAGASAAAKVAALMGKGLISTADEEEEQRARAKRGLRSAGPAPRPASTTRKTDNRRVHRMTVSEALNTEGGDSARGRSVASMRRRNERERMRLMASQDQIKISRDVIVPETITVQELANRMAERGADVIKALMRMGVMVTINQSIDADTAELIATEFGHRVNRVAESDIEIGMSGEADIDTQLLPRPPVVTVMGHVDHGKTSLLDAIRRTDVVSGEAGGITQHIGAYQVQLKTGQKITFIDTPGHAAFTEMRSRGAHVTDVVVLVVAANDSIMPQTVEAIAHAKAAGVPIIVAINKIDLPDANPDKVRQDLLQHDLVVEEMGGDVLAVGVSAKTKVGLDKLEEAILLQAEVLELRANPNRSAVGAVVEAKLDRGRGAVATVLVQKGTLRVGDTFVTGSQWGRVRALVNDRGVSVTEAPPAFPVEVLGLSGAPQAGDDFTVVESEARAREIAEFRERRTRTAQAAVSARGSLEQMFTQIQAGEKKELSVVIKGDVHGSVEAITGALTKLTEGSTEIHLRVLHSGVGAINESDVTLAKASGGFIIGFNVRANTQARDLSRRDTVEIRYYSVIYDILDDVKGLLSGMLKPTLREQFLGNAEIRQVFDITKVGKIAGCFVTEGIVKRGAKVRLLRDNVVIHEGTLKTLRRFKDEVREVRESFECGMAFENYDNIEVGDVIEAFEIESVARTL
jgi:translation initiation factor IF-2